MKPLHWVPVAVFLGVSIPLVLLLAAMPLGGEYRLWIAIVAGGLATAVVQKRLNRLNRQGEEQ